MAVTQLGVRVPEDYDRDATENEVYQAYDSSTGMEYTLYEASENTALVGVNHEAVGLVTWWRAGSLEEGIAWIDKEVESSSS